MRKKFSIIIISSLLLIGSVFVTFGNMTQRASAQTSFTKYVANPVLTVGASGQWDSENVEVATVINDGGTYKMWYHGFDISGNSRIGYATSPDGTTWTKYAGNPVLDLGGLGDWDSDSVITPTVIKDGATYKMWYSGFNGMTYQVGYATSPDGTTWTKFVSNPVLSNGGVGDWDEMMAYIPTVIYDGVTYEMWYTGMDSMANTGIGYATSADGITWNKYASNPVLSPGAPTEWDEFMVASGSNSVYYDGGTGTYMFWYTGIGGAFTLKIGYATSPDGTTWTKYASNPVLDVGGVGDWDEGGVAFATAFLDGGTYKMWYTGHDSSGVGGIGYAYESSDTPPTIEAWEPGGTPGQTYTQGDLIAVTWTASDDNPLPPNPINISYGAGVPPWTTIATDEADDGTYTWDTSAVPCPGTYWMRLSVYDSIGQTTFDMGNFSFTIFCPGDSPPTIEAWEPGGTPLQIYTQGDLIMVTWTVIDDNPLPPNPINITYGMGIPPWTTIATDEANDGIYDWDTSAVPCPAVYLMNLSVYDSIGQTTFDESNNSFLLLCSDNPPFIEAWEPGGSMGQSYTQGDLMMVTWFAIDDNLLPPNPINITYGAGAVWMTITTDEANDGAYLWDTSAVPCPGTYWMNLSVYDSIGQTTFDEGNYSFNITCPVIDNPPTVEAWEPGGTSGQIYIQGDLINITWTANDDNPWPNGGNVVNISYGLTPAGGTPIANNEFEDGIYQSWDTSSVVCSNSYWINISVYDSIGQTTLGNSNYSFTIDCSAVDNPPTITAYQPGSASGETYTEGDTITVTWNANDDNPLPASPINITFGVAGSWTPIANNQANDGSYSWDTTGVSCPGSYKMNISVRDSIGQTTFGESNYSFTINCAAATDGDVSGRVVDEDDNPIAGATVVLKDDSGTTVSTKTTSSTGTYTFPDVDFGQYTIEVSAPGYETKTTSQFTVDDDESRPDITLSATTSPPPPVGDWLSEWWWIIVMLAVVIVVILVLLLALTRRRKKPEEAATPLPPPPQPPEVPPPESETPSPPPPPPPAP